MDAQTVIVLGKNAIVVTLTLAAPLMAAGLAVGLMIGIFQTVTSIQESTLAYIPKMIAVFLALLICLPWMLQTLIGYASPLFSNLHSLAQ